MKATTFCQLKLKAEAYSISAPFFNNELSVDENVQLMLVVLYPEINEDVFNILFRICKDFYLDENDTKKPSNRIIAATAVWVSGTMYYDSPVNRALQEDIAAVAKVSTTSMRNAKNKLFEQKGALPFYSIADYAAVGT